MNKTYGVCLGMLALGLLGMGAPASYAKARLAADESTAASETATTSATSSTSAVASEDAASPEQGTPAPAAQAPAAAATPAPAAPAPLPTPAMSGPLATGIPHELSAGPFGKIQITGILSGMAWTEGEYVPPDSPTHYDVSNAQVFVQKTSGWFQFYLQGGAYNLPAAGYSFARTVDTVTNLYGPFPVGYFKLVKGNFNVEVGALPTLIGDEYTFSFENMNIERGLLWGQEPAISRGIQLNDTYKKLTLSFSWNDGFYSNRYTSLSGLLAYAINASNTLTFAAGGNAGSYARVGPGASATPLYQNNEQVYNLIYTYTKGNVTISPYYQYTVVKSNDSLYFTPGAHTNGGAILANYNFKHGISLSVRPEYIKSSGTIATGEANLLGYGSGSGAFSFTVTPTWVKDAFFVRGDLSVVHATSFTPGLVFGTDGLHANQVRGVVEAGFMF
jgi:hypothetical protein